MIGYGLLSGGKISLRSHHGVKKFFGVAGQGTRVDENKSYTLNYSGTDGSDCLTNDVSRYYILSVYPRIQQHEDGTIKHWNQKAERLEFTVQSEFINSLYDFSLPRATIPVKEPDQPPLQEDIELYYESFELGFATSLVEEEGGASHLYISATASILSLIHI